MHVHSSRSTGFASDLLQKRSKAHQSTQRAAPSCLRKSGGCTDQDLHFACPTVFSSGCLTVAVLKMFACCVLGQTRLQDSEELERACLSFVARTFDALWQHHGEVAVKAALGDDM